MKKNILLGLLILFIGFFLGGIITYYMVVVESNKLFQNYPPSHHISERIIDTSKAFSEIVESVSPAVVNISTIRIYGIEEDRSSLNDSFFKFLNPFNRMPKRWKERSLGSGVIVSEDGYIITNYHVIEEAEEILVILYDRRNFKAKTIGVDQKTDLALIKINAKGLPTIPWGNSDDLKVGEFVLAIGNPYGLSHTVTMGIISALGRANVGIADYEDFIQTDAAINPGNSGGPLVDIHGKIVGINTAIFSRSGGYQGIGFAVPSNMVITVMQQLRDKGRVIRGWIGIRIQDLTPELASKFGFNTITGALVSDVFKGSPAEIGGLKRGDIIVEINGKEVKNVSGLRNIIAQSKVGSIAKLKIMREGKSIEVNIKIAELPKEFSEITSVLPDKHQKDNPLSGITVIELTPSIAKQIGVSTSEKGVIVLDVEDGSIASEAGIKKGDLIQEVDTHKIRNYDDWKKVVSSLKPNETIVLFINRKGRKFYVAVKP